MNIRITIKRKIWIGFLLLISIFLINTGVSVYTLNQNREQIEEISRVVDPSLSAIEDFNNLVTRSKMLTTNWVYLQANDEDKASLKKIHKEEYPQLLKQLNRLMSKWKNKEVITQMSKSIKEFEELVGYQKTIMLTLSSFDSYNDPLIKFQAEESLSGEVLPQASKVLKSLLIVAKAKKSEKSVYEEKLLESSNSLRVIMSILSLIVTVSGILVAFFISASITNPINYIKTALNMLGKGELPSLTLKRTNDEIGEMQFAVGNLIDGLKDTAQFAYSIGNGNLHTKYSPLSDNDTLGKALLDMRDSLILINQKDEERNEVVVTVAEVSGLLRSHNQLDKMGDDLLICLCKKINAIQGAFYVLQEDYYGGKEIVLINSYAYSKKKYLKKTFAIGEGLVGQAAIEMEYVFRTEIPYDYVSITSGILGDKRPQSILIMPLIANEKLYGILEFASLDVFTQREINLIKELSEIVAQTIFNVQVNENTRKLLEESQQLSVDLQERQEELNQNAEEMRATQEELQKSNMMLATQIEEVNRTQKKIFVLLENASEVITICDKDGYISYVSPSVTSILGYETAELIGTKDFERIHEDGAMAYIDMLDTVIENPLSSVTIEFMYKNKIGEMMWMEASAKNLLNDDAISGIVINARDITVRKLAEKETRMRGQMQSLSENSPDLICRINRDSKFYYVNPTIELLTDKAPSEYLQKTIFEMGLDEQISSAWGDIVNSVVKEQNKIKREMTFPLLNGENKIMLVNAIPEFGENNILESVLLVSNDITDRKLQELEIQNKNKKITESINYAKRIQQAIMPDSSHIKDKFTDSFILYKAKDVVSGDFPWYLEVGDDIYIAAVDCTGHGVPGALLSLIGYFLLNDIVRSRKISDPGIILDVLDDGVTKTLRQDVVGAEAKDGMDIALCKINKKKMTVEYAGAHRSLYHFSEGELIEYKGNKFPIGGGVYKNQTNFTNNCLTVKKGDAVYFCSDGYPDQFGGPENRKLSPSRIRNLITSNTNKNMDEMHVLFLEMFDNWKGNGKQTDDVLMIGIGF